jgi:hypothetical protein
MPEAAAGLGGFVIIGKQYISAQLNNYIFKKTNLAMRLFYLFIAILTITISCSKKGITPIKESGKKDEDIKAAMLHMEEVNTYKYDDFIKYSIGFQKFLFNMLTPENRARLWKEKISKLQELEQTEIKIKSLSELKSYLTAALFTMEKISPEIESWIIRNNVIFGTEEVKHMLMILEIPKATSSRTDGGGVEDEEIEDEIGGSKCTCNVADDFCASGYDCVFNSCTYKESGCGWIWMGPCNGNCK